MNLSEKSMQYATENANTILANAIAKAYADGYEQGYKDGKSEVPVDLTSIDGVKYVDLGLPSGTLWATDYVRKKQSIKYYTYGEAKEMNLPTREQIEELKKCCKWDYSFKAWHDGTLSSFIIVGPNGNRLDINVEGIQRSLNEPESRDEIYFWLQDDDQRDDCRLCFRGYYNNGKEVQLYKEFVGYKLPVLLVK